MARDSSFFVQQAARVVLLRVPELTALVEQRVFPPQRPPKPKWPFVAIGAAIPTPFLAACLDGTSVSFAVHAYAETKGRGADTVDGAEQAAALLRLIVGELGELEADLVGDLSDCPYPATATFTWTGSQVVQDGADAGAFHGFANFNVTVSS